MINCKKILIHASSGGLGDVLMLLPGLLSLMKDPNIQIKLTISYPSLRKVINYFLSDYSDRIICEIVPFNSKTSSLLKYFINQRTERFDLIYFPTVSSKLKALVAIFATIPRELFKSIFILFLYPRNGEHKVSYYSRRMATNWDLTNDNGIKEKLYEKSRIITSKLKLNINQNFIIIAPGSSTLESHKRWPSGRYEKLIIKVKHDLKLDTVLLGGPEEYKLLEEIQYNCAQKGVHCHVLQPDSILDSIGLMNSCLVLVSGCCSAIHMASLTGTRIVGLYGPTDYKYTGPWNDNFKITKIVIHCGPCYSITPLGCGNPVCMENIDVQKVYTAVASP